MKKRLRALEEKMAKEKGIYTEEQLILLERQKEKDEFEGEIETAHPGYLGSQDTLYVLRSTHHTEKTEVFILQDSDRASDTLQEYAYPFW